MARRAGGRGGGRDEAGWATTSASTAVPMGDLIVALRDRVLPDPSTSQRAAGRGMGVGLVCDQVTGAAARSAKAARRCRAVTT